MMKASRLLTTKTLLAIASFSGMLNMVYLIAFAGLEGEIDGASVRKTTGLGRRQISSIDEDGRSLGATTTVYGHLEMMNFDLKEILDRYSASMNTFGRDFERALASTRLTVRHPPARRPRRPRMLSAPRCVTQPFLLIQIHSSPENFMSRESIRLSWGRPENAINRGSWTKPERSWKTVFLVGKSNNSRVNSLIQQEARFYSDVIIGDFPDTFEHLSLKMVLSIEWPLRYCLPKYILKTDEDCYVNVVPLLLWLSDYHNVNKSRDLYRGKVQTNVPVDRNTKSRYFVPETDHHGTFYKPYISGGGYLFSGNLLSRLFQSSLKIPVIPVEDASFGRYMYYLGVKPQLDARFLPFINCERSYETLFERPVCHFKDPFVIHGVHSVQQIHMHYNVLIMNFIPTVCSYVESQSEDNRLRRIC